MASPQFNPGGTRDYTYRVSIPPTQLPIDLATVKSYLKVSTSADDALINILIRSATDFAEGYTKRDFITRTYQTFRDFFPRWCNSEGYYSCGSVPGFFGNLSAVTVGGNVGFEIERSPLQTVTSIQYLVDNVLTTVPTTTFYNTIEEDYSEILTLEDQLWPDNADRRLQTITITFVCGLGDKASDLPDWIATGLLQHIAMMYENRGDCIDTTGVNTAQFLPVTARLIYQQNRILNI